MNNAWKINEGDRTYNKGWTNKEESPSKTPAQSTQARGVAAGQRLGG